MVSKKYGTMRIVNINLEFQDMPSIYDTEVREIVAAIKQGKKMPPILVSKEGYLQNGRHRLMAYKILGYKKIDVEYGYHPAAKVIKQVKNGT